MSEQVAHLFSTVFTLDHLVYFTVGIIAAWLWDILSSYVRHKKWGISWRPVIMVMSLIVLMYVTISTHKANECIVEFNRVLQVRATTNDEDQRISLDQRMEFYTLIHDIVFPPAPISSLDVDDPKRQQYVVQQFIDADHQLAEGFAQQKENEAERAAHPLPTPTCH